MITDRELLEGAAKAAGIDIEPRYETPSGCLFKGLLLSAWREPHSPRFWNPLTDDGDAFRLAAKLEIELSFSYDAGRNVYAGYEAQDDIKYVIEPIKEDTLSATRRAIVRAAYEIGRENHEQRDNRARSDVRRS